MMVRSKRSFLISVVFIVCLSFLVPTHGLSSTISKSADSVPRWEAAPCAVPVPDGEKDKVRCGYLVVPENRRRRNSQLIRLPIVILKSGSANPAPDPVLRTLGGPGGSSLRMIRGRRFSPWLNNRDMVIFEQRGTRYAQPNLDCPEVDTAKIENVKAYRRGREAVRREVVAAATCRNRLAKHLIDLTGYDSEQSAADIEDLRRVLGYEKWNLYGVSYSSRLMLNVMRAHPEGIRSVVLESVLPPSVNYDEVGVDEAVRALNVFFANCRNDSECNKNYPELEKTFYEVVRNANKVPLVVGVKQATGAQSFRLKLNGHDVTTWVLDYILSAEPESIRSGPSQIEKVAKGDLSPLQSYAQDRLSPGGYMWGMRFSVWCREEMPFESRKSIVRQSQRYSRLRGYEIQPSLPAICDVWRVPSAARVENQPVISNLPTLVLAGEYDAYTPPAWGRLTAATLPHSYFFEVPGVGHGPGFNSDCARKMITAFFDHPSLAPNDKCLQAARGKFTTSQ